MTAEELQTLASFAEAAMIACFGASWPFAVRRTWRTKQVAGISPAFLGLIFLGYAAGLAFKLARWTADPGGRWVIALYILNFLLVGTEIVLYLRFRDSGGDSPGGAPDDCCQAAGVGR